MKKMKILAITHQLDFSGAPVALFEALKILKDSGYDVDIVSLKNDEGLGNIFINHGINLLSDSVNTEDYDYVIFNTLITIRFIPRKKSNTKYIAWIHESPYLAGLAWNPEINIENIAFAHAIIFPSRSSREEWSQYIDTRNAFNFFSPISIPNEIRSKVISNSINQTKRICVIDPRESYRGIERIEKYLTNFDFPIEIHFIGAKQGVTHSNSKYVKSFYYGRVTRVDALKILSACDIYLSATCMATQNRGLCEALLLNKNIFLSSINIHKEIGELFSIPANNYFSPLEDISIDINTEANFNLEKSYLFSEDYFKNQFISVLNYSRGIE